jgi:N-acetylmuramoyl-L-alanine amidase
MKSWILFHFLLTSFSCISLDSKESYFQLNKPIPYETINPKFDLVKKLDSRWSWSVSSIVIHNSDQLKLDDYIKKLHEKSWFVHIIVDTNGDIYGYDEPGRIRGKAVQNLDNGAIHVAYIGKDQELLNNPNQYKAFYKTIKYLSQRYGIRTNNRDVNSKKGIFTHTQAKKRYGKFHTLTECGGERVNSAILREIGGSYFPEIEWKDRGSNDWVLRMDTGKSTGEKRKTFEKGRGITPTPMAELKSVESVQGGLLPENYRIQYFNRGRISPSCVVLHFTALATFKESMIVLERRGLTATIMVDELGKAYQLLDSLNDYPSTAFGTNQKCVQIEIVGRGTEDLMKNEIQAKKVIELVKDLSSKFNFSIQNYKIDDFSGVYSHTQAKKKWGGSVHLSGKDFDPGEDYMKKIIQGAGGTFYPEENWFERNSMDWVILFYDFMP